ncbi:MAG TPA: class I SAM-dependent methyltransferase [Chloroflexota bacterium]
MTSVSEQALPPGLQLATACRVCGSQDLARVLDLGATPLANSLRLPNAGDPPDLYPLDVLRCRSCSLVQLGQVVDPGLLFSDYVYFSSYSDTMLRHAETMAKELIAKCGLDADSLVVEVASNDGYLLQFFQRRGVPVLGIEPARNIASHAEARGISTLAEFFDQRLARRLAIEGRLADVLIGNNVLAHVPDLSGFAEGVRLLLRPEGVAVFEVPYVRDMLDKLEFDTIYHEHQCYFSLTALQALFQRHELDVTDVERLDIHGGSLRVFVSHAGAEPASDRAVHLLDEEAAWGAGEDRAYDDFAQRVQALKHDLADLVARLRADGRRVAAYGAAAKGVTLASFCGLAPYLEYVVDRSPHKQGRLFPVGDLPIYPATRLEQDRPDYTLLLTWNFAAEIREQQASYEAAGGHFILPVPSPRILEA